MTFIHRIIVYGCMSWTKFIKSVKTQKRDGAT